LNTTGSNDVHFTVAKTFLHSVSVGNFVAASDSPFDMTVGERQRSLDAFDLSWSYGGEAVKAVRATLSRFSERPLEDEASSFRARSDLTLVTDDNMATEFKSDWAILDSARSWRRVLRQLVGSRPAVAAHRAEM
jgi:hypothetical protein